MITIPAVKELLHILPYFILLLGLALLAWYDHKTKRLPNKALLIIFGLVLICRTIEWLHQKDASFIVFLLESALGAVMGGGLLFIAALITNGGIGGGDIKLAFILGLCFGSWPTTFMLLIAAPAALVAGTIQRIRTKGGPIRIAFCPFLLLGSLAAVGTLLM